MSFFYTRCLSSVHYVRVLVVGAIAAVALAVGLDSSSTGAAEDEVVRGSNDPNVIVVMVDDQSLRTFSRKTMPHTFELADGGEGTRLRGYASPPLCCPARAGFLTGQYPHNHGVRQNDWGYLEEPDNTLPAWLQNAGYATGFVGKYLNEYDDAPQPAGGWDSWFETMQPTGYFKYLVSNQGIVESRGKERADYSTRVVTQESRDFIREEAERPFFLWTSYFAPHARNSKDPHCGKDAPIPLPDDWDDVRDLRVELSESYDERDVSDKPARVRHREPLGDDYAKVAKDRVRCTIAAMAEVDSGVRKIRQTLRKLGIDDDTVIIYVSDNGFYFGEHRIDEGKYLPYAEAVRVPMMIHVPPKFLSGGDVEPIGEAVANIDLAPTILDLAGAEPCTEGGDCRVMDGRSIVPLIKGNDAGWPNPRPIGMNLKHGCVGYEGVYKGKKSYVKWFERVNDDCRTPERELYDLRKDPGQLENRLHGRPSKNARDEAARLSGLVDRLMECSGIEGRDPKQPDRPFC
jgi:N-acetylglucosamine-6-sulfatase